MSNIYVGIGGWTFEPWRENFYPTGLPKARELHHASRQLTAIEVNGTYYSTQKPATFARWRDTAPDGFVFALKASRFATHRRVLAEAGESVQRFVDSGIAELGPKLGPIVWQFAPTKAFDADDFGAFLKLLPASVGGVALRHVVDVRHASFMCGEFLALMRRQRVATVFTDSGHHPSFADITGGFVYGRLMRSQSSSSEGFTAQALAQMAACAGVWRDGGEPAALPRIEPAPALPAKTVEPRDVFLFFIGGAKERAPAAAMALLRHLREQATA